MGRHVFSFRPGSAEGPWPSRAGGAELQAYEGWDDDARGRERLLGCKGARLAALSAAGLPVPPGVTISAPTCAIWRRDGGLPPAVERELDEALALLERHAQKRLGDPAAPLLVAVRAGSALPGGSGAAILGIGLNEQTVEALVERTGDARFAYELWRRSVVAFAGSVLGMSPRALAAARRGSRGQEADAETLRRKVLPALFDRVKLHTGSAFPTEPRTQLRMACEALLRRLPAEAAAITVQAMVFGDKGATSAVGRGCTRDAASGAATLAGSFLVGGRAAHPDTGNRTPRPVEELKAVMPGAWAQLRSVAAGLEQRFRWPQAFEFVVEDGALHLLDARDTDCEAPVAIRWALDLLDAGVLGEEEALLRVPPTALDRLLHPSFDPVARAGATADARGQPAAPGAATGQVVFGAAAAERLARAGKKVVLVRTETGAADVAGMEAAQAVLTATGGLTSHAAVVGRQLGKPCVVGAAALAIDEAKGRAVVGGRPVRAGDPISIDGGTGEIFLGRIAVRPSEVVRQGGAADAASEAARDFRRLLEIADRHRRLGVLANADQPRDARIARAFGAEGIGLCRTEHMFFEGDRIATVQRMILGAPAGRAGILAIEEARALLAAAQRGAKSALREELRRREALHGDAVAAYRGALDELLPLQRADFVGLFETMAGQRVTIRTLDPPLHEFLPRRDELLVAREALRHGKTPQGWPKLRERLEALRPVLGSGRLGRAELVEALLRRVEEMREFNPMLGHRGCRVGISYPEITAMQARAIFEAAANCRVKGIAVQPEILIPFVASVGEMAAQKAIVLHVHAEVQRKRKIEIPVQVGTMIEVPRGALTAAELAREAEFFSFGSNDLTQTTWGYSRDDTGRLLDAWVAAGLLQHDPFRSLDEGGVGRLIRMALEEGRTTRPGIRAGICGEHGGDPASIALCHALGLGYVSCSPWRVPVARLAAAQATIREKRRLLKGINAVVATGPVNELLGSGTAQSTPACP